MKNMKLLSEAKQHLRDGFEAGTECPCCGRFVKAYKRKLNSGMAPALILIYKLTKNKNYVHIQNEFVYYKLRATTMDYAYAEKWKLIEADSDQNGYWRITQLGKSFVLNQIDLPEYCLVYNGNVYKWADDKIGIKTALTISFDYSELMKPPRSLIIRVFCLNFPDRCSDSS